MPSIRTIVRLRPSNEQQASLRIVPNPSNNTTSLVVDSQPRGHQKSKTTKYAVDEILGINAGQGAVFNVAGKPTVDAFIKIGKEIGVIS